MAGKVTSILMAMFFMSLWAGALADDPLYDDCVTAYTDLGNQEDPNTMCNADNCKHSMCKTKAKHGSCEIKLCAGIPQNCLLAKSLSSGEYSVNCQRAATLAREYVQQNQNGNTVTPGEVDSGTDDVTVSVQLTDPDDNDQEDCGSSFVPCKF